MKNKNIPTEFETFAPLFPGFYETAFDYDSEEAEIDYYNEGNNTSLTYDDFIFDYADYRKRVSIAFVNRLETELKYFLPDIKIEFEGVYSPKEYNFYNDHINIKATLVLSDLIKLIEERKEKAEQYFKDKYTSYDGFYSSHSNDISDWLNERYILENPEHRVGALLDCLLSIEIEKEDIYYWADGETGYIDYSLKSEVEQTN